MSVIEFLVTFQNFKESEGRNGSEAIRLIRLKSLPGFELAINQSAKLPFFAFFAPWYCYQSTYIDPSQRAQAQRACSEQTACVGVRATVSLAALYDAELRSMAPAFLAVYDPRLPGVAR